MSRDGDARRRGVSRDPRLGRDVPARRRDARESDARTIELDIEEVLDDVVEACAREGDEECVGRMRERRRGGGRARSREAWRTRGWRCAREGAGRGRDGVTREDRCR